jgi:TPR repeat protein
MTLENANRDHASALAMLRYRAEGGDPQATIDLETVYYHGQNGQTVDFARARTLEGLPELSAANGLLGRMYHFGDGVPADAVL